MRVKSVLATVHNLHGKSRSICVLGELTDRHLFHPIFLMENFIPVSSWALILCSLSLLERALKLLRTTPRDCAHTPTPVFTALDWPLSGFRQEPRVLVLKATVIIPQGLLEMLISAPPPLGLLNHKLPRVGPSDVY